MKKLLAFLLSVAVLLSLTACDLSVLEDLLNSMSEPTTSGTENPPPSPSNIPAASSSINGGNQQPAVPADYDFMNLGLSESQEEALILFYEIRKPGSFSLLGDPYAHICANGDIILLDDGGDHQILTFEGGFRSYKLHKNNTDENDYDMTDYAENKKEFYSFLSMHTFAFTLCSRSEENIYSSAQAFLDEQGITLLGPGEVDVESPNRYELLNYREYSGTLNTDYIVTGYMHPQTRYFEYLSAFSDKLLYWEVRYINDSQAYVEASVFFQFTDAFDHRDYDSLKDILVANGVSSLSGNGFAPALENGFNTLEGQLSVYTMPFEHEGENWYDTYKLMGCINPEAGLSFPYSLQVDYLYKYWYDGGSFATYVRRLDGLWRFVFDSSWLMIAPDGTVYKYDPFTGLPL